MTVDPTTSDTRRRSRAVVEGPERAAARSYLYSIGLTDEDLQRPIRATAGAAAFRGDNTVDRQFEVVDPIFLDSNWIPKGRDTALEEVILQRIRKCL